MAESTLDESILFDRAEIPGARLKWRMQQADNYSVKYNIFGERSGVKSVDSFAKPRMMVHLSTVRLLKRAKIQCPRPGCGKSMQVVTSVKWFD